MNFLIFLFSCRGDNITKQIVHWRRSKYRKKFLAGTRSKSGPHLKPIKHDYWSLNTSKGKIFLDRRKILPRGPNICWAGIGNPQKKNVKIYVIPLGTIDEIEKLWKKKKFSEAAKLIKSKTIFTQKPKYHNGLYMGEIGVENTDFVIDPDSGIQQGLIEINEDEEGFY